MANTLVVNEILIFQNQNHNIIKNYACMFVEKWMKKKINLIFIVPQNMIIYVNINVTYFFGRDIVRQSMVYVCSIKQLSFEIHSQKLKDPHFIQTVSTHCIASAIKLLTNSTHLEVKMELLSRPSFTAIALIKHNPCFLRTTPFSGLYSYRNRNKNR